MPNTYEITYHWCPLRSHSLGQRASAMMLFLLSQKEHDLVLIDQPEDDLDSQTVYEEVVKRIRELKRDRQFIFATHNANFPVLGDSESVFCVQRFWQSAASILSVTTSILLSETLNAETDSESPRTGKLALCVAKMNCLSRFNSRIRLTTSS